MMPEVVRPETISDCAPDDSPKAADWDWEPSSAKGVMTNPEVKSWEDNQGMHLVLVSLQNRACLRSSLLEYLLAVNFFEIFKTWYCF